MSISYEQTEDIYWGKGQDKRTDIPHSEETGELSFVSEIINSTKSNPLRPLKDVCKSHVESPMHLVTNYRAEISRNVTITNSALQRVAFHLHRRFQNSGYSVHIQNINVKTHFCSLLF